jgi:signal transduction histidine kinase
MEDLSLHIMDIAENSIRAGAQNVEIKLSEDKQNNTLILEIVDDGKGMNHQTLKNAADPFYTTKEGKKFGLGLSLLAQTSEEAGGSIKIEKREDKGTRIIVSFIRDHIDLKPMGDIKKTIRVLRAVHPEINFSFKNFMNTENQHE